VTGFIEHINESSVSMQGEVFLDKLSDYHRLSAPKTSCSGNGLDLYSGAARVESRPGHLLS
jgi:hypothetical protein